MKSKKAQLDEFNPIALVGGILGGILAIVVMSKVEVGIIYKVLSFIGTAIVCFFMTNKILGD
jgi:hypothetical protein